MYDNLRWKNAYSDGYWTAIDIYFTFSFWISKNDICEIFIWWFIFWNLNEVTHKKTIYVLVRKINCNEKLISAVIVNGISTIEPHQLNLARYGLKTYTSNFLYEFEKREYLKWNDTQKVHTTKVFLCMSWSKWSISMKG